MEQYLLYFCGDANDPEALLNNEPLRISFYKSAATFLRAYAAIVQHLENAGYSAADIVALEKEIEFYSDTRNAIKKHSGEEMDIKPYEADMRHLINTYIQADPAEDLGDLSKLSLIELIIETGINDAIVKKLNQKGKLSRNAIAEGIINNVRKTIIRDQLTDPKFYEELSKLLEDLIQLKKEETEDYEKFLKMAEELVKKLHKGLENDDLPAALRGKPEAAVIYRNLESIISKNTLNHTLQENKVHYTDQYLDLALQIDNVMRENAPAYWKGDVTKERQVLNSLYPIMSRNREATQAIFEIIKNQPGY